MSIETEILNTVNKYTRDSLFSPIKGSFIFNKATNWGFKIVKTSQQPPEFCQLLDYVLLVTLVTAISL